MTTSTESITPLFLPNILPTKFQLDEIKKKYIVKRNNRSSGYNLLNILFNRGTPQSVALNAIIKDYLKSDGQPRYDKTVYKQYERRLRDTVNDLACEGLIIRTKENNGTITISLSRSPLILMISNRLTKSPTTQKPRRRRVTTHHYLKQRWLKTCSKRMTLSAQEITDFTRDFAKYKTDKINSSLLLKKRKSTSKEPKIISIPMSRGNRFIDPKVQKDDIAKYNAVWQLASTTHEQAVFLTITIDTKGFDNLVDANAAFPDRLEKFYRKTNSLPSCRNKSVDRLVVHEFNETGLRHAHIVLFGIGYLAWMPALKQICKYCGLRESIDICKIKKDPVTNTWNCSDKNPRKLKYGPVSMNRLKEYLCKVVSHRSFQKWHWLFQTPFFTTSKSLMAAKRSVTATPKTEAYEYLCSCPKDHVDDFRKELLEEINGTIPLMRIETMRDRIIVPALIPANASV